MQNILQVGKVSSYLWKNNPQMGTIDLLIPGQKVMERLPNGLHKSFRRRGKLLDVLPYRHK